MRRLPAAALVVCSIAATARADDWEVKRSPFNQQLVDRYRSLLRKDPDDAFAWKRLTSLYQSYRTLEELERQLKTDHELYLLGKLARDRGDHEEALRRFAAAWDAKKDARAYLAIADEMAATKVRP